MPDPFLGVVADSAEIEAVRAALNPRQFRQAMYQAVKRTTDAAKKIVSEQIEGEVNIKMSALARHRATKDAIVTRLSKGEIPVGEVVISGKPLPMTAFLYKAYKKSGVVVAITQNRSPVILKHAFKQTLKSGHVGIFLRATKGGKPVPRYPIREVYGPSIPSLVERPVIGNPIMEQLAARLHRELESQMDRFTKGGGNAGTI